MTAAGLGADIGVAIAAFAGTNVDNTVVTAAMVAGAPLDRGHRIAVGQVVGFLVIVATAAAGALILFEFSPAQVGLLGFVPLAIGIHGLIALRPFRDDDVAPADVQRPRRRVADRGVGRSLTAAALVTIGAGGDNLAVYIPLFREGGTAKLLTIAVVFAAGEVAVTAIILAAGRHPRVRVGMARLGEVGVPLLLCAVGILVLVSAGTLSWL